MRYYSLTQKGFVSDFVDMSRGKHKSKFCFVLGAGASKSSGIMTGQELVDLWEKELMERDADGYKNWKKKKK